MQTLAEFLGGLVTPQGRLAGQPFGLFPWEFKVVDALEDPGDLAVSDGAAANGKIDFFRGPVDGDTGRSVDAAGRGDASRCASSHSSKGLIFFTATRLGDAGTLDRGRHQALEALTTRPTGPAIVDKRTGAGLFVLGSDREAASRSRTDTGALADEPSHSGWKGTRDSMLWRR